MSIILKIIIERREVGSSKKDALLRKWARLGHFMRNSKLLSFLKTEVLDDALFGTEGNFDGESNEG